MSPNLGSHDKLLPAAETAGRQLVHSWIVYGPKELNHFEPELFPTGPLQGVAGGVLSAMNEGVRDFPGLVVWFADAPDGVRAELIECSQGFAPQPTDCNPAVYKLWEYDRQLTIEKLTHQLTAELARGDDSGKTVRKLAKVHAEKFQPRTPTVEPADVDYSNEPDCFEPASADLVQRDRIQDMPFRLLGMDDGVMRYMPDNGQHIVSIPPCGHSKLNLMQLAPLQAWEEVFPGKSSTDWEAAANSLIQCSQALPKFDPRAIRGRGCWIDGEDVIYHAGSKLAVNGTITPIPAYNSPTRAIYEGGLSITIDTGDASRNVESAKLIELCDALPFDQPLFGKLLAGWMALSPICGALMWRPHIWVTGASGSGKSWITGNIIYQLAGKSAIYVKGNTSEAGIRGRIGSDALPVLFDEAEAENQRSIPRMDGVLELARQSSSEDGGGIVKGTQNGGSITYMVRSMFCFASIGVAAVKKADTSRISVLSLRKDNNPAQFEAVKALWRVTAASPAYCSRFRARAVRNAITTRANAEVFSEAAVAFTGDKRSADQVGTLLAGAFSLTSSKPISLNAAVAWLEKQDWSGFRVEAIDSDENQCLAHLLSAPIRVERQFGAETITLDEAIERARMEATPGPDGLAMLRIGVHVGRESVHIANNHQGLERIFANTPWSGAKWRGQLLRVEGALTPKNPVRFGPSVLQRAVTIPI